MKDLRASGNAAGKIPWRFFVIELMLYSDSCTVSGLVVRGFRPNSYLL